MTRPTMLVTGATGKTGASVVEQSLKQGLSVRALVRRLDERSEKLEELGADIVVAAQEAGVDGLVNMSQLSAREEAKSPSSRRTPSGSSRVRPHNLLSSLLNDMCKLSG